MTDPVRAPQGPTDKLFPNRDGLREFLKAHDKYLCENCGCCELVSEACDQCGGDGVYGHDCGEDCCCCADPEDNEDCDYCDGLGFTLVCIGNCGENDHHRGDDDKSKQSA